MSQLTGIDHVQLAMPPGKEDLARAFYGAVLGLNEVAKPSGLSPNGVWFEHASLKIHLGVEADFRPARKAHPGILVSDLAALSMRLEQAGYPVTVDKRLRDCQRFFVDDPFGNRLEFLQVD